MKILIDADACPVVHIVLRIARQRGIPVVLVTDDSHVFAGGYAEVVTVGQGTDAVDLALVNRAGKGDIVITQDYGVAALALAKKAYAINQNGMRYTDENIEGLLNERHMAGKARRTGGRTKGFRKRTGEEDVQFEKSFSYILDNLLY
jgi:uncharacterized protein YaiI (UPF0178 family)